MTFVIHCPHCGAREALEYSYGGETTSRAADGAAEREFTTYLYFRENVDGWQTEWWVHQSGCRAWFLAERHTTTNEIRRTYRPAERPRDETAEAAPA